AVAAPEVRWLALGSGVVADPRKLLWEARPLEARGFKVIERLLLDERLMLSDLTHRLLDLACEHYRAEVLGEPIRGTTGRGITPAFLEENGQWQLYYASFREDKDAFAKKLRERADRALRCIEHVYRVDAAAFGGLFDRLTEAETRANAESIEAGIFPREEFDFGRFRGSAGVSLDLDALIDAYWECGQVLRGQVADLREELLRLLREGKSVIGEFGQAYWLDKRRGYPPNLTASHTFTPEIFESAGIPLQPVHAIGVCKAYDTKVGTHLFLTEMPQNDAVGDFLRRVEYGTSTGRQRMVGWFDAVEKGDALRFGGFQDLVINKLDALTQQPDWPGSLKICTHYTDADGQRFPGVPRDDAIRARLRPHYIETPGWAEDISPVRRFAELPANARRYIALMLKSICDVASRWGEYPLEIPNIRYIGVGPDPSQIIRDIPPSEELLQTLG
ncbi:MAG: adenylosuccinate synthetase, partial [Verrucomicrobiota bacterium]